LQDFSTVFLNPCRNIIEKMAKLRQVDNRNAAVQTAGGAFQAAVHQASISRETSNR
jgi:hypothetical protein